MIKNTKKILSVIILMSCCVQAQVPNGTTSNSGDNWNLLSNLSDEFNSNSIDWNKWSKSQNLPNTKAWKWNNNENVKAVSYNNEKAAEIVLRQNENNKVDGITYFNSGCLQAVNQLPKNFIGYVETRMYGADINAPNASSLDKRRGVCPAFWLYSNFYNNKPTGEAVYTEIDVVELQQFDYDVNAPAGTSKQDYIDDAESNLHLVKKTNSGKEWYRPKEPKARGEQLNKYHLGFDPTQGWHTYGCEITPTKLYFYVDGVRVGKVLNNTYWSTNPLSIIASLGLRVPFVNFSNNVFNPINPETNERASKSLSVLPVSMYVDYIRVWKKSTNKNNVDRVVSELEVLDNNDSNVTLVPNPTSNFVVIKAPFRSRVLVFNTNGIKVKSGKLNNSGELKLRVSDLTNGIYNVRIVTNGDVVDKKLVVN